MKPLECGWARCEGAWRRSRSTSTGFDPMNDLDAFTGIVFGTAIGSWIWAGIAFLIYLA